MKNPAKSISTKSLSILFSIIFICILNTLPNQTTAQISKQDFSKLYDSETIYLSLYGNKYFKNKQSFKTGLLFKKIGAEFSDVNKEVALLFLDAKLTKKRGVIINYASAALYFGGALSISFLPISATMLIVGSGAVLIIPSMILVHQAFHKLQIAVKMRNKEILMERLALE